MSKQVNRCATGTALMLVSIAFPVCGADWAATAGVAPGVLYTDNVCLAREDEQGEWVALVTPDVSVNADGNRANFNLDASVEINSLTDSKIEDLGCNPASIGNRSQFSPRLAAGADVILLEQWLYFDATAAIDQNATSPFFAGGDGLNTTGNTNTTTRYSLSPYISHRLKDVADVLLRYTWDEQFNSTDIVRDSSEESVLFTLASNPASAAIFWGIQADYSNVKYGNSLLDVRDAPDSELSSGRINLGYQLTRKWQVNGYYGKEKNDFISLSDEIDGDFWDVGIRWTPNGRTVVEVGTGERFFGDTPRLLVSHQHKRSTFSATYLRDLSYDRNIRTLGDGSSSPTVISNSPILDERFTLGYSYNWRRSTLDVNASFSDQTRSDTLTEQAYKSVSVALSRTLSRQMSVNGSLRWSEGEPKRGRANILSAYEAWELFLGLSRAINSNTDVSLDYYFTDRQSDAAGVFNSEYTENRIMLSIRFRV